MENETKRGAVIVNEDGATMMEIKGLRVEGDRIVVRGALMGAWDTDMYLGVDDVRAAVAMAPIGQLVGFVLNNLVDIDITKLTGSNDQN